MSEAVEQAARLTQRILSRMESFRVPESLSPTALRQTGQVQRGKEAGFTRPVGAAVRLRLNRLRRIIKEESPIGKPRPRGYTVGGKRYTYRKPYRPGSLKRSWDLPGTVVLSASGKTIQIRNPLPHAKAQDKGARIPERRPRRSRGKGAMLMFPAGGRFFHRRAKAFKLKGQDYVRRAVEIWRKRWGYEENVRWSSQRGVRVEA